MLSVSPTLAGMGVVNYRERLARGIRLPLTRRQPFVSAGAPVFERQALGMMLALLAYSMLALQDATVKWLVDTVPVWQVLFLRSALGCSVAGGRPLLLHAVTTPTWALLARRGAV